MIIFRILDDLERSFGSSEFVENIFTQDAHHLKISVIISLQSMKPIVSRKTPYTKIIMDQANVSIFTKTFNKQNFIQKSKELFPGKSSVVLHMYESLEKKSAYPLLIINELVYDPPLPSPCYTFDKKNRIRFITMN